MDTVQRIEASWATANDERQARVASGNITWSVDWTVLGYANMFYFGMLVVLWFAFNGKPFDTTYAADDKEKKKPIKGSLLSTIMKLYNLTCVLAAASSAYCMITYIYLYGIKFAGNVDLMDTDEGKQWLQFGLMLFYYQKFWEFIDTFIFMLRNSYRQVSFLHVYHHCSITIVVALFGHFDSSGDCYLPVILNSVVHVIMYGYYFCGANGFKFQLVLRPYITQMQLTQFLIIAGQAFYMWSFGPDAGFPDFLKAIIIVYMSTMLFLFGKFFVANYMTKKKPKSAKGTQ